MSFGGLLAARRTQKNLSQAQLAERVGVSAQTVYRWEYDLRSPDVEQLKKLCAALDVAPGYFLCEEEKNGTMPENKGTNDGRESAREAGEGERENCLVPDGENEKLLQSYRRMFVAGIVLLAAAAALFCGGMVVLFRALDLLYGYGWSAEGGASVGSSAPPPSSGGGMPQTEAVFPSVWLGCVLAALAAVGFFAAVFLLVRSGKKRRSIFFGLH